MQGLPQDWVIVGIIVAVIVVLAVIGWIYSKRRRTERLRTHFGNEYEKAVTDFGDRNKAERDLTRREQQLSKLKTRPLSHAERQGFSDEWHTIQGRFVDDPRRAAVEADRLVTDVLRARGYPTDDIDERFDDLSAAYPNLVGKYREACLIVVRNHKGEATTEDLRRAMVLYRDLFDELFREDTGHEELRRVS